MTSVGKWGEATSGAPSRGRGDGLKPSPQTSLRGPLHLPRVGRPPSFPKALCVRPGRQNTLQCGRRRRGPGSLVLLTETQARDCQRRGPRRPLSHQAPSSLREHADMCGVPRPPRPRRWLAGKLATGLRSVRPCSAPGTQPGCRKGWSWSPPHAGQG